MSKHFDLLVIGAGSGGLAAATRAASFGAKVAIIENNKIGGTCVNVGCVPKKIMWYSAQFSELLDLARQFGFQQQSLDFDFSILVKHRENYIKSLRANYVKRMDSDKITYLSGTAAFLDKKTVNVNSKDYSADHIIIATGCHSDTLEIPGENYAIDSDAFFHLTSLPKKITIIGAGYIAVELACMMQRFGSQVKIIMRNDKPLRHFDAMISDKMAEMMAQQGIELFEHHAIQAIKRNKIGKLSLHFEKHKTISNQDLVLAAIGRSPRHDEMGLKSIGVKTDKKGFIHTDKNDKTNVKHIYAIGDVAGKKLLTPVAVATGRKLASRIFAHSKEIMHYEYIPTVIFSHPPIGTVGLSEADAIAKHGKSNIVIYTSKFRSMLYGLARDVPSSYMKLITLKKSKKVIGCHLIDPHADEILQGFAVAIRMGATKSDFDHTIGIHPTSAEELVTMR
jgi:glutathione reductase (NADPH)